MHCWNSRRRESDWARLDGFKVEIKHFCIRGWRVEGGFIFHLTTSCLCRPSVIPSHLFSSLIARICWRNHPHLNPKAHLSVPLKNYLFAVKDLGSVDTVRLLTAILLLLMHVPAVIVNNLLVHVIPKDKICLCTPSSKCNITCSASEIALPFIWLHHTLKLFFTS